MFENEVDCNLEEFEGRSRNTLLMSNHTNDPRAVCENSAGDGCSSCMATLFQASRRARNGRDCPGDQPSAVDGGDRQDGSAVCEVADSSRLLLLTFVAYVLPLIVIVAVVQFLESHVGSALAAITGVVAAGSAAVTAAGIVKFSAGKGAVDLTGADPLLTVAEAKHVDLFASTADMKGSDPIESTLCKSAVRGAGR